MCIRDRAKASAAKAEAEEEDQQQQQRLLLQQQQQQQAAERGAEPMEVDGAGGAPEAHKPSAEGGADDAGSGA